MPTHTVTGQIRLQTWGQDKLLYRVPSPNESRQISKDFQWCGRSTKVGRSDAKGAKQEEPQDEVSRSRSFSPVTISRSITLFQELLLVFELPTSPKCSVSDISLVWCPVTAASLSLKNTWPMKALLWRWREKQQISLVIQLKLGLQQEQALTEGEPKKPKGAAQKEMSGSSLWWASTAEERSGPPGLHAESSELSPTRYLALTHHQLEVTWLFFHKGFVINDCQRAT